MPFLSVELVLHKQFLCCDCGDSGSLPHPLRLCLFAQVTEDVGLFPGKHGIILRSVFRLPFKVYDPGLGCTSALKAQELRAGKGGSQHGYNVEERILPGENQK